MKWLLAGAVIAALVAEPSANAAQRPVNEGDDTRPCVTYAEFTAVFIGTPRRRAEMTFDTKGEAVRSSELNQYAETVGLHGPPEKGHQTRRYPVCPGEGEELVISYHTTTKRDRIVAIAYD